MDIKLQLPDLKRAMAELKSIDGITKYAGAMYLNHFKDSFRQGGFIDRAFVPWPQRAIAQAGAKRGLLVQSGALRRSLTLDVKKGSFVIESALPYAALHNNGGKLRITKRMRKFFWAKHMQAKKAKKHTQAAYWKGMAITKRTHFIIPQRRFMGTSAVMEAKIKHKLDQMIKDAFGKV